MTILEFFNLKRSKGWLLVIILLLISPIFGVILADMVGYHEPLDLVAENFGLEDKSTEFNWTPFYDYNVPGLPSWLGYIISGFIGILFIGILSYIIRVAYRGKSR